MKQLTKKQQDIVDLASAGGTDKELALLKIIHGLEDKFDAAMSKVESSIPSVKDIVGQVKGIPGQDSTIPGPKGDKGDKGDTVVGPPGKDGKDSVVPGPPGKDGKTPSTEAIVSLIKPLIPDAIVVDEVALANTVEAKVEANLPALGTRIRDALELLNGEERLDVSAIQGIEELEKAIETALKNGTGRIGWGAHPLTLMQSGTVKAKTVRHINFTGATVTLNKDGVVTVAITGGGSGWTVETPTGTVDGSNTVFTATATPKCVIVDGITYFENNGYTLAGLVITTTVPPTGFIRDFF